MGQLLARGDTFDRTSPSIQMVPEGGSSHVVHTEGIPGLLQFSCLEACPRYYTVHVRIRFTIDRREATRLTALLHPFRWFLKAAARMWCTQTAFLDCSSSPVLRPAHNIIPCMFEFALPSIGARRHV